VRQLLKILALGTAAFVVVAMLQEWQLFATAWFGLATPAPAVGEAERAQAEATLRQVLSLERHFYASGGDTRFAERMPVGDGLREEMADEAAYLSKNHRRQQLDLHQLEITEVRRLDDEHLELRTREYWTIRTLDAAGIRETDPARAEVIAGRYLLTRAGDTWRVEQWEIVPPEQVARP